jgi:hypothetical protein
MARSIEFDERFPAAELYAQRRLLRIVKRIGAGKDGSVFRMSSSSAVKIHERRESFEQELLVYQRLRACKATEVAGFKIPRLRGFAEDIFAIEMTIVHPPFVVDFASAVLDQPYDFPPETIEEWHARLEEQFEEHVAEAHHIIEELGKRFGVWLYDLHRHNIKFRGE